MTSLAFKLEKKSSLSFDLERERLVEHELRALRIRDEAVLHAC